MDFNEQESDYLDELIHSDNEKIVLDYDIIMEDDCIGVNVDELCVDGAGYKIHGKSKCTSLDFSGKNIIFKNITFEGGLIEIAEGASVTLERCIFKSSDENVIINQSDLSLNDCSFEKHHKIKNYGNIETNDEISAKIIEIEPFNMNNLSDGTLNLNSDMFIEELNDSEIELDELIIEGNNHTIENKGLELLKVKRLTIKNLNFYTESELSIQLTESMEIVNCKSNGLSIRNSGGKLTIENSTFDGDYDLRLLEDFHRENVNLKNKVFFRIQPKTLISNENGEVRIEKSDFKDIDTSGHTVLIENHSGQIHLNDCSFDSISSSGNGGIINNQDGEALLENCLFKQTRNGFQNRGGAIYNEGILKSVNCKYIENKSQRFGGAVANLGKCELISCEFIDNFCDVEASAIYNDGLLDIDDCLFNGKEKYIIVNDNEITIKNPEVQKHHRIISSEKINIFQDEQRILKDQILTSKNGDDLNELIHSGKKEIILNNYFYADSISIDVDNLTIDGKGNTIDARLSKNIFKINADNIVLKNITFKNVYSNDYSAISNDNKNLRIENCVFENNRCITVYGGAINNYSGDISIVDTIFKDNVADYSDNGGAIYNLEGNIHLKNCKFLNNKAGDCGGAIYNEKGNIDLTDCYFKGNTSSYLGETMMVWYGGAIYNKNGMMDIDGCEFIDNTAWGPGDAIFNESRINIKNSIFKGDSDDIISNHYFSSIESCQFENSLINNSGIIRCSKSERDYINGFIVNDGGKILSEIKFYSSDYGFKDLDNLINNDLSEKNIEDINLHDDEKVIDAKKDKTIPENENLITPEKDKTIPENENLIVLEHDISIQEDEKETYGDGIEIEKDNLTIDGQGHYIDCNLESSIFKVNSKTITFRNIVFRNASSINYGAIKSTDSSLIFENCHFNSNAANFGGAILSDSSSIKLKGCKFENNFAYEGSSIKSNDSNLDFENCEFMDNSNYCIDLIRCKSLSLNGCKFFNNANLIHGLFINGSAENCLFENNKGNRQLIILRLSNMTFKNSSFKNNESLFIQDSLIIYNFRSNLFLANCNFENNLSNHYIIGSFENSHLIMKKCSFKGEFENILNNEHMVNLVDCNFEKHHTIANKELISNEDIDLSFKELINGEEKKISLDKDYFLMNEQVIEADNLCIDGNMHEIYGKLTLNGRNVLLKNIAFKNPIKIENNGIIEFENCTFECKDDEAIINRADLTLRDCEFNEYHKIINSGKVRWIENDQEEDLTDEIIDLNKDDDKDVPMGLGALFG